MRLGTQELLIVLAIAILIFGPAQLPKLSKIIAKLTRIFISSA